MSTSRPFSDSPWFWILIYSGWTFIALALLSLKYGSRQSQLERQFQGRMHAAESKSGSKAVAEKAVADGVETAPVQAEQDKPPDANRTYSTPENTIIGLAPLAIIFGAIAFFAAVMLGRERWALRRVDKRLETPAHGDASP